MQNYREALALHRELAHAHAALGDHDEARRVRHEAEGLYRAQQRTAGQQHLGS